MLAIPIPLSVTPPAIPAQCVPWYPTGLEGIGLGLPDELIKFQPSRSSVNPFPSSSTPFASPGSRIHCEPSNSMVCPSPSASSPRFCHTLSLKSSCFQSTPVSTMAILISWAPFWPLWIDQASGANIWARCWHWLYNSSLGISAVWRTWMASAYSIFGSDENESTTSFKLMLSGNDTL